MEKPPTREQEKKTRRTRLEWNTGSPDAEMPSGPVPLLELPKDLIGEGPDET